MTPGRWIGAVRVMVAAAMGLWLSACASLPPAPQPRLPQPQTVAKRLEERRQAVRGFVMQGEIRLTTPTSELNGDQIIQGAWPGRLRAEVLGPFGRPVLLFISDGAWMAVLDYQAGRGYEGRATRANVARFLGLRLSVEEIYALITGNVPLLPGTMSLAAAPADQPGMAVLEVLGAGGAVGMSITFAPGDYQVSGAQLNEWDGGSGAGGGLTAAYSDFQRAGAWSYPRKVALIDGQERKVELNNFELTVNPALDPAIFEPRLPPGVPVEGLR